MAFHGFIKDRDGWQTHSEESLFRNPFLEVNRVRVTSPTRSQPFEWTVAHRKGAVVVAPRTAAGDFLLIRQERVPIRASLWEFPAGQIDHAEEHDWAAIQATGLRELREESGYELAPDGEVISLGYFFPSAGFTDEHSHLVLVRSVIPSPLGCQHDALEAITECRPFTPAQLSDLIATGEIRDANTLAAYARLVAKGLL